ncbi:helix-turn-helix transcriptional regulator [Mycobacterium sp. GA-2829]|uniref:helix-turn-helix transcriptional regulator n=1 Tax=Mycobacterium sp. GA-2829 TaxID=1772283 RepID=UPI00073FCA3A|nr:helix-turn-helix transcriptional regulator [Mycobacterium sp. GA-2829]KUI37103.1 hypothetical protein AU194_11325 [Mycobacterium sp. GA-2829]
MTNAEPIDEATGVLDPGVARAGAAAAARRRELDISQRSLAADGIINAGALIAFEKGRSWPRERTRAKLEEVLRWPTGTIAKIRRGEPVTVASTPVAPVPPPAPPGDSSVIAQAVESAVNTIGATAAALPAVDHPDFTPRVTAILAEVRQLESAVASAARLNKVTPPLIKALSAVRRRMDELTMLAASAPNATIGQRLYAARRRANLTIDETAQAAGVSDEDIANAEAERPISANAAAAILALIGELD